MTQVKIQEGKVVVGEADESRVLGDVGFSKNIESRVLFTTFKNLSRIDNNIDKILANMNQFRSKAPGMDRVIGMFKKAQSEFQNVLVDLEMEAEERQEMGK